MTYNDIRILVVLWEHPNFAGRRVVLTEDTPNLGVYGFHDMASAIGIHRGPNFGTTGQYRVSFFQHSNYLGAQLVLWGPGSWPDLRYPFSFNDMISSVNFGAGEPVPNTIAPIPVVGELYEHPSYAGRELIVVEDIVNLHSYSGFGDIVSSAKIFQGPNYAPGDKFKLFRDTSYRGGGVELDPGDYPNLGTSHGFNDVVSSVRVN